MKTRIFETQPAETRDYFIDILKSICIIFIIVHHLFYFCKSFLPNTALAGFQFYIYQAVPVLLIISGYLWTLSYEKNKFTKFWQPYKPLYMLKKFIRLFVPYVCSFIIILSIAKATGEYQYYNWWKCFWVGGPAGYGGYYVPIMISLILFLPICWIIVKKWGFKGFVGLYVFNILWEIFRWSTNMDLWSYEVIIFRYTALVAYGVYLAYNTKKKQKIALSISSFVIGATFLSILYYTNYKPIIIYSENWRWSNITTYLYIIPIVGLLFRKCHISNKKVGKTFGLIGKASYSFYLAQNTLLLFEKYIKFNNNEYIQFWINWGLIIAAAIAFYIITEKIFTKKMIDLINWIFNRYHHKRH